MKVYILRGISGAGKSTFARYLQKTESEVLVCSADAYMDDGNGGYRFDSRRLEDAHKYCLRTFIDGLQKRWSVVVLDNTNITFHEFRPYVVIAEAFDYEVEVVTITGQRFWRPSMKVRKQYLWASSSRVGSKR